MIPLLAIVGPTATGKSALAVRVSHALAASKCGAEVVNADPQLVYRGMDIGTAKPDVADREGVVHHLVDTQEISETTSVADFQRAAREVIEDCRARGVVPIVVGGSALYIRAILDDFDFPGTDPAVRERWERELARVGPHALHARLAQVAPEAARDILPGNGRRIVRALEVVELTGSFSATLPPWRYVLETPIVQVGLDLNRELLDERIAARVDDMWNRGLVAEVAALERQGLREGRTAAVVLGYRQVLQFLAGEISEQQARDDTITGTRRFARKQLGWFRRDPRIAWLPADGHDNVATVVELLRRSRFDSPAAAVEDGHHA